MHTLRTAALGPWAETQPVLKAQATLALDLSLPVGASQALQAPLASPGRPLRPECVHHTLLKSKSMTTPEGRAILVHSIAHIELNAIDLALDVPEFSPRELAVRFTHQESYFVSEASVYRLLKAHDLITSPAYVVIKAADSFKDKTTAINQLWP